MLNYRNDDKSQRESWSWNGNWYHKHGHQVCSAFNSKLQFNASNDRVFNPKTTKCVAIFDKQNMLKCSSVQVTLEIYHWNAFIWRPVLIARLPSFIYDALRRWHFT